MRNVLMLCAIGLLALTGCSRGEEAVVDNNASKEISLVVLNYEQYVMDGETRASAAEALDNLMLGVFDATTGEAVQPAVNQKKGDSGYGTFKLSLPYGEYQLAVVGYNGTRECINFSATNIAFAEDYVPHTFLCNKTLQVNASTDKSQTILLKRAVAAFVLKLNDMAPANVVTMRFASSKGGTTLNPQTGYTTVDNGRTNTVNVPNGAKTKTGAELTSYLYLPTEECTTTYVVSALDQDDNVVRERTFPDVPMKINRMTRCEGEFFSADAFSMNSVVQVDTEWSDTVKISY